MFLLVPAYPGCPGSKAVKRSLLLLLMRVTFSRWRVQMMGHMLMVAERVVVQLGVSETSEYRVVINNELHRRQPVYHPQIHVLAGRQLHWPPG